MWVVFALFFVLSSPVLGVVRLDAEPLDGGVQLSYRVTDQIRRSIALGELDGENILFPIETGDSDTTAFREALVTEGQKTYVRVSSKTFGNLPSSVQHKILEYLTSNYDGLTYRLRVDKTKNQLENEPLLKHLDINVDRLPVVSPAENLLSAFAQQHAYRASEGNCWQSAIASINNGWERSFCMASEVFATILSNSSFQRIESPSQWGDLIRISAKEGFVYAGADSNEVHGFTFLGVDSKNPRKKYVFTKNGCNGGPYLFMDLDTVAEFYKYWGRTLTYFRLVKNTTPPNSLQLDEKRHDVDPFIHYGLMKRPSKNYPPISLH